MMPRSHGSDSDDRRRRFEYHVWATATIGDVLVDDAPRACAYMAHACTSDRVWLLRLRGEPTAAVALWPELPADDVRALAEANAQEWSRFLAGLDDDGVARPVTYTNSRGETYTTPAGDILDHVLLHGAYHRGQAAAALRAAGVPPPATDFIVWVRM
jgi:uncharacterized damage-inducible protein DinB